MSSAAAVAREGLAHHDHLLALFSSPSRRTSRPAAPPRAPLAGIDLSREAVIEGRVVAGGMAVPGAYVRLLDRSGAFVAEAPTDADGTFRFYAEPGQWTLRVQSGSTVEHAPVEAERGSVAAVVVTV